MDETRKTMPLRLTPIQVGSSFGRAIKSEINIFVQMRNLRLRLSTMKTTALCAMDAVVISTQHDQDVSNRQIHEDVINKVIKVIPASYLDDETKFFVIQPVVSLSVDYKGDSGLTGH